MIGVPLAGEVGHLLLHQIHGAPQHCLPKLMAVPAHQAILVAALHLVVVALDHQLGVVIEPMNLLLMHGVQILDHHQLLVH